MRALGMLTVANLRSYVRDRSALFWTLAFPLIFIVLFGLIFENTKFEVKLGFADEDGTPAGQQLAQAFASNPAVSLVRANRAVMLEDLRHGDLRSSALHPDGSGAALASRCSIVLPFFAD